MTTELKLLKYVTTTATGIKLWLICISLALGIVFGFIRNVNEHSMLILVWIDYVPRKHFKNEFSTVTSKRWQRSNLKDSQLQS